MGARRSGREAALQMLFQLEASQVSAAQATTLFWRTYEDADPEGRPYAETIVHGVDAQRAKIDERIGAASQNWRIDRMSRVDRNLLRLATWELLFQTEVPRAVIIDEAVELAKSFGTDESSAFVNGVLDRIANDIGRKDTDRSNP